MSLSDEFEDRSTVESPVDEAARLNLRDDLDPEQRDRALAKRTTEIEGTSKSAAAGDRTRREREAKENPIWTAEALALEPWSTYNVGYNFKHTAEVYTLMFASFVGSDSELWDRAATMRDWQDRYAPTEGSYKTTLADMPNAAASFYERRAEEARAEFNDKSAPEEAPAVSEPTYDPDIGPGR